MTPIAHYASAQPGRARNAEKSVFPSFLAACPAQPQVGSGGRDNIAFKGVQPATSRMGGVPPSWAT